jgi:hypothetical protein
LTLTGYGYQGKAGVKIYSCPTGKKRQNDAIKTNANQKQDDLFSFLIKLDEPEQDIDFTFKNRRQ